MCWDIGRADTALEDTGPVGTGRRSDTGSADTVPADIAHQSGTARRQARRTEEWRPRQLPPDGKGAASWECLLEAFYTDLILSRRILPTSRVLRGGKHAAQKNGGRGNYRRTERAPHHGNASWKHSIPI